MFKLCSIIYIQFSRIKKTQQRKKPTMIVAKESVQRNRNIEGSNLKNLDLREKYVQVCEMIEMHL